MGIGNDANIGQQLSSCHGLVQFTKVLLILLKPYYAGAETWLLSLVHLLRSIAAVWTVIMAAIPMFLCRQLVVIL